MFSENFNSNGLKKLFLTYKQNNSTKISKTNEKLNVLFLLFRKWLKLSENSKIRSHICRALFLTMPNVLKHAAQ